MQNNIKNNKEKRRGLIAAKILENKFYPLYFLIIIVFVAVSLVMVVNNVTRPRIIAERDAAIIRQFKVIFSEMEDYKFREEYYEIYSGGDVIGYTFIARGKGYGGEISILVGINKDFTVKKITIIANTETPGLGTKIKENFFTDQFAGLSSKDISLTRDGGKIDAITSATISSRAVTDAVKSELEAKIEKIKGDVQ